MLLLDLGVLVPLVPYLFFSDFMRLMRAMGRQARNADIPEITTSFCHRLGLRRHYGLFDLADLVRSSQHRCASCACVTTGVMLSNTRIVCRVCAQDDTNFFWMVDRRFLKRLMPSAGVYDPRTREIRKRFHQLFKHPDRITRANRYLYFAYRAKSIIETGG